MVSTSIPVCTFDLSGGLVEALVALAAMGGEAEESLAELLGLVGNIEIWSGLSLKDEENGGGVGDRGDS